MRFTNAPARRSGVALSCGTIIVNPSRQILLCHATGLHCWDIPKGVRHDDETPLEAARRELQEETGLAFGQQLFEDLGCFSFQPEKALYLFKLRSPSALRSLAHLRCTSYFVDRATGRPMPEMDDFRWASRSDITTLCPVPLARRLLALSW
ncbi:NUDIX hydrolase [Oxalobacteraceae bacterium OM1]|nr:NUDIX hydrolase [Oxalobacteraceae bacterium OM1]